MNLPSPQAPDDLWKMGPIYTASDRAFARNVARPVREFLRVEVAGSLVLVVAAAIALIWANSGWAESYDNFWHAKVAIDAGPLQLEETLQHWVNDGLMVIFFFVVGLEIKYEIVHGDLRDPKTAALPIFAAVGGMVLPALIYVAIAGGPETGHGWGIPMATDIAFAVGVLGLLGRRIPSSLRLFLLTLAIVDDIGAIMVIAVFYTSDLALEWLGLAFVLLVVMVVLKKVNVWSMPVYVILGVIIWFAFLESGVHATLAGVFIGLLTPAHALLKEDAARGYAQKALRDRNLNSDELDRLRFLLGESVPVVQRLQHTLHPISSYFVLPVFALANAGVYLGGGVLQESLTSVVAMGVAAGLVIGKPVGVVLGAYIAIKIGVATLPDRVGWGLVAGAGMVAGIGFTVSLFIAGLSFEDQLLADEAKVGILGASIFAAIVGAGIMVVLTRDLPPEQDTPEEPSVRELAAQQHERAEEGDAQDSDTSDPSTSAVRSDDDEEPQPFDA